MQCNPDSTEMTVPSYTVRGAIGNKHSRSQPVCTEQFYLKTRLTDSCYLAPFPFCFIVCQPTWSSQSSFRINSLQYPHSSCKIIHKANKGMIIQTELVAMRPHYLDNNTTPLYISAIFYTTELVYALFGLNWVIIDNLVWSLFELGMRSFVFLPRGCFLGPTSSLVTDPVHNNCSSGYAIIAGLISQLIKIQHIFKGCLAEYDLNC